MASKSKRRSKARTSVNLIDHVQRNLDRGNFKKALKDARVCYRQDPTPEHRCFLEHACVARAQQLSQQGLREDCRRIVRELLDLGATEPSVQAGLPELLVTVGMLDCLPQGPDVLTDEQRARLKLKAADQAVLRPEDTPKGMSEFQAGARNVRAALQAVERGNESVALTHLKDISHHSPFADWKYLVRGLTAYYQHEKTGMLANWDRLDADRAAATIAAPLRVMAGVAPPLSDALRAKVSRLERELTSQAVLGQLASLRQFAADHDWPQVFKRLRSVRAALRKLDARVYQRLVSCLCGALVHEGLVDELERLAQIADPLPIDPHWNRARAVAREMSDFHDEADAAKYWRKYLGDLQDLPTLSPSERKLARGMIWVRLAMIFVSDAEYLRDCRCGRDHTPDIEEAEEEARSAFERCLTLVPAYAPAYTAMATFHMQADRPDEAADAFRRLLEHVPDNLNALLFLGKHYVAQGEPMKAREFAERAREQKPLDKKVGDLLWTAYVGAARDWALEKQYEKAREELAAADRFQPARSSEYDVLARKAVLEIKAGSGGAARRLVEQAQEGLGEPTALWLVMTIEAIRYDLPREETWLYEKRWQDALKRRCRSETAGLMCQTLNAHLNVSQPYPHHREHAQDLLKYVRRCSRVKWRAEDLRYVCEFLEAVEETKLLAKFAKKGTRNWPEIGYFHWSVGLGEMAKGPRRYHRQSAIDHLKKAIELASKSGDPRDGRIVEMAKRSLTVLEGTVPDFDHDDYEEDDLDEYADGQYGDEMDGVSPGELYDAFRAICGRMGLDPDEVLGDFARDRPKPSGGRRKK